MIVTLRNFILNKQLFIVRFLNMSHFVSLDNLTFSSNTSQNRQKRNLLMKEKWVLKAKEVCKTINSSNSGGRKKLTKSGRNQELREVEIILTHITTDLRVSGNIKKGNYSRKELMLLSNELEEKLFIELENKVAKYYKISGK